MSGTHSRPCFKKKTKKKQTHLPAAKGGLQQGGDAHTKENGANQLTGCPLVKSHTHGLRKQEGYSDSSTEAGKIVLRKNGVERKKYQYFYLCYLCKGEHQISSLLQCQGSLL